MSQPEMRETRAPWPPMLWWGIGLMATGGAIDLVVNALVAAGDTPSPEAGRQVTATYLVFLVIGSVLVVGARLERRTRGVESKLEELDEELGCWSDLAARVDALESTPIELPSNVRPIPSRRR